MRKVLRCVHSGLLVTSNKPEDKQNIWKKNYVFAVCTAMEFSYHNLLAFPRHSRLPYVTSGRESSGGSRFTRLLVLLDLIFFFFWLYPIGVHFRKNQWNVLKAEMGDAHNNGMLLLQV
jgi:hypothetical protein